MIKAVSDVERENGDKTIQVKISNTAIKILKAAVNEYKGDKDDSQYVKNKQELKDDLHELWALVNPS